MSDLPLDLIPLAFDRLAPSEQERRLGDFCAVMAGRGVSQGLDTGAADLAAVAEAIRTAGAAPSGANLQPWHFTVITDPAVKQALCAASERAAVKRLGTLPPAWQAAATAPRAAELAAASCLIAVFRVTYTLLPEGGKLKHYYVQESTGIAVGFLLAALQHAGIAATVHIPVPELMTLCGRPHNEAPFCLIACGSSPAGAAERAAQFCQRMRTRRVIREFSAEPASPALIEGALAAANGAPKNAGLRTWHFGVITDPAQRHRIRREAEQEEKLFYETRITPEWRRALAPLGTDWEKPFLDVVSCLIVCFEVKPQLDATVAPPVVDATLRGAKVEFTLESAAIAAGILIAALHHAGLACLTHTPSPMGFLRRALQRPANEVPFLQLPVGYPAPGCQVPNIHKKPLAEIMSQV